MEVKLKFSDRKWILMIAYHIMKLVAYLQQRNYFFEINGRIRVATTDASSS